MISVINRIKLTKSSFFGSQMKQFRWTLSAYFSEVLLFSVFQNWIQCQLFSLHLIHMHFSFRCQKLFNYSVYAVKSHFSGFSHTRWQIDYFFLSIDGRQSKWKLISISFRPKLNKTKSISFAFWFCINNCRNLEQNLSEALKKGNVS